MAENKSGAADPKRNLVGDPHQTAEKRPDGTEGRAAHGARKDDRPEQRTDLDDAVSNIAGSSGLAERQFFDANGYDWTPRLGDGALTTGRSNDQPGRATVNSSIDANGYDWGTPIDERISTVARSRERRPTEPPITPGVDANGYDWGLRVEERNAATDRASDKKDSASTIKRITDANGYDWDA